MTQILMPQLPLEDDAEPTEVDIPAEATVDEAGHTIEELGDGSAVVTFAGEEAEPTSEEFQENLADGLIPEEELSILGANWVDLVETDKKARSARDEQYAEGIRRTGLGNEAPGGADFQGASKVVHPMLAKACVEFASKAIKELFPSTGPCRTHIIGEATDDKVDKAERKKTYMNWQLTQRVEENRAEYERLLSQLPLGGSQYKRWWFDVKTRRPRTETVYVDDVFLPYDQSDFYSTYRYTHRQLINKHTYEERIRSGLYRDLNLVTPPVGDQETSASKAAAEKVEGSEEDIAAYNSEGLREIYEIHITEDISGYDPEAEGPAPYIAHVDKYSERVLGVYRNWKEGDELYAKQHWMVEYTFIPWRGAYGIGLGHLIGSLSGAATGSLRAILDAAHFANFPGGVKLKGGRNSGQSVTVNATELVELDAPPGVDDIRKLVMGFPFPGPSNVLYNVLEWLTQQAEGVISTASEKIADGQRDMPVGTALALIEHGAANFSAIHARLHDSLRRELGILHRLNGEHLNDKETVEELGELVVSRADFQGPMDIIPVSDPNIFSEAQRYAQLQAVLQLRADPQFNSFFKPDRLLQRAFRLLQIPAPEDIANLPLDPEKLPPLEENYVVGLKEPRPLKVYEDQDDLAHLEAHTQYMSSPMFGSNPLIGPRVLPPLLEHCQEHMLSFYRKHTKAAAKTFSAVALALGYSEEFSPEEAEVKAAAFADQVMAQLLGPQVLPALEAAAKKAQEFAPKPQATPDVLAKTAADKELEQMRLNAQAQREELDRKATEAENARDRNATLQAANIAAAIERASQQTEERLTTFGAAIDLLKTEQATRADRIMAEFVARQERLMAVLTAALSQQTASLQASQEAAARPAREAQQTAGNETTLLAKTMQDLASFIQESHASVMESNHQTSALVQQVLGVIDQPKFSEYVRDEKGGVLGVRTSRIPPSQPTQ